MSRFLGALEQASLVVPWPRHGLVHRIHEQCRVLSEDHADDGTHLVVRGPKNVLDRLRADLDSTS